MATLNFPNTLGQPTDGSFTYIENDVIYSWNGTYWSANNGTDLDNRYVNVTGDTMTGDLTVPNLESAGDIQSTSQNGGPLAGFRNQLINGDFRVWQRGSTFAAGTDQVYTADRWFGVKGSREGSVSKAAVSGIPNCAYAATIDMEQFYNNIELDTPGTGSDGRFRNGMQYTLSFWSNAPVVNAQLVYRQGTSIPGADQAAASPAVTANGDLQPVGPAIGSFQKYSHTFTINSQSLANHTMLAVLLYNDTGAYSLTGIQLEPGPVATPFELRPIATELALCQRYTYVIRSLASGGPTVANGYQHNANDFLALFLYPVELRTIPTLSTQGGLGVVISQGETRPITSLQFNNPNGVLSSQVKAKATTSAAVGQPGTILMATGTSNAYIFDAEL